MREEIIKKVDEFMCQELMKLAAFEGLNVRKAEYRIEHSRRVANIMSEIAFNEGFDVERAYVAGLLHDIGYSIEYKQDLHFLDHGRVGAMIAKPFLQSLGYTEKEVTEMCYGIAIHVDDKSDFEFERTPLAVSVGDADNIDRFDAYRLYEGLHLNDYMNMPIQQQSEHVNKMLEKLNKYYVFPFSTPTATKMWKDKIKFQIDFYERLKNQIENSNCRL